MTHVKTITFIEPKPKKLHIYSKFELPRLGSILLATIARNLGYETKVLYMREEEILKMGIKTDLVAISTITPTAPQAYNLGDYFRGKGIPVIMGGPHVTFLPEEALEHSDYCIRGEGEKAFPQFLEALNRRLALKNVPGLGWRKNGKIILNAKAEVICNMDSLPFPDLSLVHYGRKTFFRNPVKSGTIPIQTSRGCPYDCTFCSVTEMFGKRYRFRSAENVISELRQYNPKKHFIFFYDDNFTANRNRAKKLLRMMIELNLGFQWSTQVRTDIAKDPELLDLMKKAGCRVLYIGFESVDPESLSEMKKSQSVEEIKKAIREIHKRQIFIHGMFVFGFDADTKQGIRQTVKFAIKQKIDTVQFMILTPFPGTQFYSEIKKQNRILGNEWGNYDAHHVQFQPSKLTGLELQQIQIKAHGKFYSVFNVLKRLFSGNLRAFIIGLYANKLNKKWSKIEAYYLSYLKGLAVNQV